MTKKIRVFQGQKYELAAVLKLQLSNVELYVRAK